MAFIPESERILLNGTRASVEYAYRTDGSSESRDWLESDPAMKRRFGVLFERLCSTGRIANETQFRRLLDPVWEFKRGDDRLLCFRVGSRFLLTHRIKKSGGIGKCPRAEIDHAKMIGREVLEAESQYVSDKQSQKKTK
jgi:hypothetical protein